MKKKFFLVILMILIFTFMLYGCATDNNLPTNNKESQNNDSGGTLQIQDGESYSGPNGGNKKSSSQNSTPDGDDLSATNIMQSQPINVVDVVVIDSVKYTECGDFYYAEKEADIISGEITIKGEIKGKPVKIKSFGFKDTLITSVNIENGVEEIEPLAFTGCSFLLSFRVDDKNEFYSSQDGIIYSKDKKTIIQHPTGSRITTFNINEDIVEILPGALEMPQLKTVTVSMSNNEFISIAGVLFNLAKTILHLYPAAMPATSYSLPNTVETINSNAFNNCKNLQTVNLNANLSNIGEGAFRNCNKLQTITIPSNVTEIKAETFARCSALAAPTIPSNVTSIGRGAFELCSNQSFNNLVIPNSVTSIGKYALYGCTELATLTLPIVGENNNSNSFLGYIFGADSSENLAGKVPAKLKTVNLTQAVTKIGDDAFKDCTSITNITINANAQIPSFGNNAFKNCSNLTSLTIPNSVQTIGSSAFEYCKSLQTLTLGSGLTSINNDAFKNCGVIQTINIPTPEDYLEINFSNLMSNPIWNGGSIKHNGNDVTSISVPSSVTSIKSYAFLNWDTLTSISMPNSVQTINEYAFYNCDSLKNITLSTGLTNIGQFAFSGSGIAEIIIPENVTEIKEEAFSSCIYLQKVTFAKTTNGVITIRKKGFYNCKKLDTIVLPEGLQVIEEYAFDSCGSLQEINIPASVTTIGDNAFTRCFKLATVTIDSSAIASSITTNLKAGNLCGTEHATTIYIKDNLTPGSYITTKFGLEGTSDKEGYKKYQIVE